MAITLTGSTGKTTIWIGALPEQANIPSVLTSRRGQAGTLGMPVA